MEPDSNKVEFMYGVLTILAILEFLSPGVRV